MREYESLVGKRYGKLVVKELLPDNGSGHRRRLCQCDRGNMHEATTGNLNSGNVTNFGSFSNFEDAVKAKRQAEEEYFGTFLAELSEQSV